MNVAVPKLYRVLLLHRVYPNGTHLAKNSSGNDFTRKGKIDAKSICDVNKKSTSKN